MLKFCFAPFKEKWKKNVTVTELRCDKLDDVKRLLCDSQQSRPQNC